MPSSNFSSSSYGVTYQRTFEARDRLPPCKDALWKINLGVVRINSILENGLQTTIGIFGPGDIVGTALSILDPIDIECLTPVEAHIVPLPVWQKDTKALANHIYCLEELSLIRSHRRVDEVLLKLLTWLGKRFGSDVGKGHLIDLRLSHQDIAEMIGTNRVTVTRILNQLASQGVIERLSLQRILVKECDTWHYQI